MRICGLILAIAALTASPISSGAFAQESEFEIELNTVKPIQNGCRVVFVAVNRLGTQIDKMAVEIGVFDDKGIFSDMVVFDFGRLPAGKTKVVQYDLPRQCTSISRLLLNGVKECTGQKDMRQECEDRIKTRSLVNIGFGQ